jgi:hypothetical protein
VPKSKKSRISEEWSPSRKSHDFALARDLTPSQIDDEVFLFRRHWLEKKGKNAKKPDWDIEFQTWIVRGGRWRIDRSGGGSNRAPPSVRPEIDWDLYVGRYRTNRAWVSSLGPAPDHAGCRAPSDVLHRHDFGLKADAA